MMASREYDLPVRPCGLHRYGEYTWGDLIYGMTFISEEQMRPITAVRDR